MSANKKRQWWINVAVVLAAIIVGLLLCEFLLRGCKIVVFNNKADYKNVDNFRLFLYQHEEIGWFSRDPILYWRFNQGSFGIGGEIGQPALLNINSNGIRGPEIVANKPANTIRIVCLGDSVTMGWETKYELTYEQQLQSILNTRDKRLNYEVINAGIPGYTAYQGYALLNKYLKHWKPDVVTVYFGSNDRYDAKTFYRGIKNSFLQRADEALRLKSRLYGFLQKMYLYVRVMIRIKFFDPNVEQSQELKYKNYLESIIDLSRENNIKPILVTYPTGAEIYHNATFPYNRIVMDVARRKDCVVVDLVGALKIAQKESLFYDNVHPTPLGHHIIAKELADAIIREMHSD